MFDRPIGKNQAIQHPLAECWMELEAADLMTLQGGLALRHRACRAAPRPTAAKYLAGEAGFKACEKARDDPWRLWATPRNSTSSATCAKSLIARIAPISPQLILSFIAEKVLGLPKSY